MALPTLCRDLSSNANTISDDGTSCDRHNTSASTHQPPHSCKHPKPEQIGEDGNAARVETPAIEKHPVPWKEFRGIPQFNTAWNVEMVVAVQNEFVAVIHERLEA